MQVADDNIGESVGRIDVPKLLEGSNYSVVVDRFVEQAGSNTEVDQFGHSPSVDSRVVIRRVSTYEFGDQCGLVRWEEVFPDPGSAIGIFPEQSLCSDDRAGHRGDRVGVAFDRFVGDRQRREGIGLGAGGAVTAAGIENNGTDATRHGQFGAHTVRPESVDQAFSECLGRGEAEGGSRPIRRRHGADIHGAGVDPEGGEKSAFTDRRRHGSPMGPVRTWAEGVYHQCVTNDPGALPTALHVKIDDELPGPRWTGRPPVSTVSELVCPAVAQSLPGFTSEAHWLRFGTPGRP